MPPASHLMSGPTLWLAASHPFAVWPRWSESQAIPSMSATARGSKPGCCIWAVKSGWCSGITYTQALLHCSTSLGMLPTKAERPLCQAQGCAG